MWTAAEKYPAETVRHYRDVQRGQGAALAGVLRRWRQVDPGHISESWEEMLPEVEAVVAQQQMRAVLSATATTATAMASTGAWVPPDAFLDPRGFVGAAPNGASLAAMLASPVVLAKTGLARGMSPAGALKLGESRLKPLVATAVTDAGRAAASVDVATRRNVGYVRMLNPPSCSRCVVLAGTFYRWNTGFRRHPNCDCVHQPVAGRERAEAEGLLTDPYEYFNKLSPADQAKYFGTWQAQAIRDGADIYQVVNASRGTEYAGLSRAGNRRGQKSLGYTTEGTSKRGYYRLSGGQGRRLTPEAIYQRAGGNRETALRLLQENGYLLPREDQRQVPGGAITGPREGYGALGRGGTRVGASEAVRRARATGIRDQNQRATMTEAERRRFDAGQRWQAVREGRNPFGRGPLTPDLAARAENDYRRIVLLGDDTARLTTLKQAHALVHRND